VYRCDSFRVSSDSGQLYCGQPIQPTEGREEISCRINDAGGCSRSVEFVCPLVRRMSMAVESCDVKASVVKYKEAAEGRRQTQKRKGEIDAEILRLDELHAKSQSALLELGDGVLLRLQELDAASVELVKAIMECDEETLPEAVKIIVRELRIYQLSSPEVAHAGENAAVVNGLEQALIKCAALLM